MNKKIIMALFCLTTLVIGCKKYEDGPMFNLRSKKARVANTWIVSQYLLNNKDLTEDMSKKNLLYVLETTKDGVYSSYYPGAKNFIAKGKWMFSSDNKNLILIASTNKTETFEIHKLTEKELHLVLMSNSGKTKEDLYFKPY